MSVSLAFRSGSTKCHDATPPHRTPAPASRTTLPGTARVLTRGRRRLTAPNRRGLPPRGGAGACVGGERDDAPFLLVGIEKTERRRDLTGPTENDEGRKIARDTRGLTEALEVNAPPTLHWSFERMPEETHAAIYHLAALRTFRRLFKPAH